MSKQTKEKIPWQEEETPFGGVRRYRIVGGIKEYEMMVQTSSGVVPESEIEERNRLAKKEKDERLKAAALEDVPLKICPFSDPGGEIKRCSGDRCAFYDDKGCAAFRGASEDHNTIGKQCPMLLRQPCRRECSFYFPDGCSMLK